MHTSRNQTRIDFFYTSEHGKEPQFSSKEKQSYPESFFWYSIAACHRISVREADMYNYDFKDKWEGKKEAGGTMPKKWAVNQNIHIHILVKDNFAHNLQIADILITTRMGIE